MFGKKKKKSDVGIVVVNPSEGLPDPEEPEEELESDSMEKVDEEMRAIQERLKKLKEKEAPITSDIPPKPKIVEEPKEVEEFTEERLKTILFNFEQRLQGLEAFVYRHRSA